MATEDYVVFGGKLKMPGTLEFHDPDKLHVVGRFAEYDDAYKAWQSHAYSTIDDAHACYVAKKVSDEVVTWHAEKCPELKTILG
ncbi:DUF4170 domain-containing protein [Sulfitobacter sp. R18_1]|uniref:DUF4170 domain-containing protein n=1 Tax=Sulfitobacter sp. R18_1 TaxID=2821104 RepID=UPI001ADA2C7B|nr:DUF4170 domain-containing protein [Sulfitobacter sp. R18_1]MBO9428787.1 DUF4170 domain-containing protein [Sulfitobacter sp. R18_1]